MTQLELFPSQAAIRAGASFALTSKMPSVIFSPYMTQRQIKEFLRYMACGLVRVVDYQGNELTVRMG